MGAAGPVIPPTMPLIAETIGMVLILHTLSAIDAKCDSMGPTTPRLDFQPLYR